MTTLILSVYIVLLLVGGYLGFKKAGSRVSLITATVFAVALGVCAFAPIPNGLRIAEGLQVVLVLVFTTRYLKTKKFMPAGLMLALTVVALVAEWFAGAPRP
jgi:uncharacterized membrane protein (UPF0136 family)